MKYKVSETAYANLENKIFDLNMELSKFTKSQTIEVSADNNDNNGIIEERYNTEKGRIKLELAKALFLLEDSKIIYPTPDFTGVDLGDIVTLEDADKDTFDVCFSGEYESNIEECGEECMNLPSTSPLIDAIIGKNIGDICSVVIRDNDRNKKMIYKIVSIVKKYELGNTKRR